MAAKLDVDLSLCIIVGPKEAFELKRCLESAIRDIPGESPLFEDIAITVTSDDVEVREVAEFFTRNVSYFQWCKDFAKARNFNFSHAKGKHILWLDADDVIDIEDYKKILRFKKELPKHDMVLIDYIYALDENEKPIIVLPRERIVRNCEKIKWHDPIHEYLNMDGCDSIHKLEGAKVCHKRMKPFDPIRNLSILKEQYDRPDVSARTMFYYGKELADTGDWEEGLKVLERFMDRAEGFRDNLAVAAIKVSRYYFSKGELDKSKTYAMKGIHFNPVYAENYVVIGDILMQQGDFDNAIKYYEDALTKKLNGGMSQLVDFYKFLPAANLAILYQHIKNYEKALEYAESALTEKPMHEQMLNIRKEALGILKANTDNPALKNLSEVEEVLLGIGYSAKLLKSTNDYADIRLSRIKEASIMWLVPFYNINDPATRIRRINVNKGLISSGVKSDILADYHSLSILEIEQKIEGSNIAVLTVFGEKELQIAQHLRKRGVKVIFDLCEAIFDVPFQAACLNESDAVICCSTKLTEMYVERGYKNVSTVKDAIEKVIERPALEYYDRYKKPRALYMGMGGNSFLVTDVLKPVIEKAGYELVVISEWDNADRAWALNSWADDMLSCDVVLCPQREDVQPAKSNVKLTTAMALGMPVLCTPIKSYQELIRDGENGYLCQTFEDWGNALAKLRDPNERIRVGKDAFNSCGGYKLEDIVSDFKEVCQKVLMAVPEELPSEAAVKSNFKEPVDLIITNYNNVEYLKTFISSILLNTLYPFNIIISDAGSDKETWDYLTTLKGMTILGKQGERKNFSESCNAGIAASRSKYFVILNSDLIVSKCWLTNLVHKMDTETRLAACGVLSNCDRGWLFDRPGDPGTKTYPMYLNKACVSLVPGMKLETIKPHIEELYAFMGKSNKDYQGTFIEQQWVAAYATMFARSAVDEVGYFDTDFKNGCEDLDLCRRLASAGYRIGQAIDSFVFHFGGVSRGAYQLENKPEYDKEDRFNHTLYTKKWEYKKIVIWTGPAWEPWTKETVDKGMAGSETWAAYLAIAFAKRGFGVVIYNDLPEGDRDLFLKQDYDVPEGVNSVSPGVSKGYVAYRHHTHLVEDLKYDTVDYFISSRTVDPFALNIHAIHRYVMVHDIWLSHDNKYDCKEWLIEGFGYLSQWHKEFLKSHHSLSDSKLFLTANGVDMDLYKDVDQVQKKNQITYSSSPDRGLFELLKMFPKLREVCPDLKLVVAYGFYNWETAAKARGDENALAYIKAIKKAMEQDGIEFVGRVSKKELAQYQMESKWWFYPTWFQETFCISSVENGLAKNALLSTDLAGLKTTVGVAGILLKGDSHTEEYQNNFIEEAKKLITDGQHSNEMAMKALTKMKQYSWDTIAEGWMKKFGILR